MKSYLDCSGLSARRQARRSLDKYRFVDTGLIININTQFSSITHVPARSSRLEILFSKPIVGTEQIRDLGFIS